MMKLVSLFVLLTACAAAPRQPLESVAPPPVQPAPKYELLSLDHTGATGRTIWIEGRSIEVGIATRGEDFKIVRIEGDKLVDIFVPPRTIAGVPAEANDHDYSLPPVVAEDGQFFVSASTSAGNTQYIATWTLTWNPLRAAFDISAPHVQTQAMNECLTCDA